MAECPVQRLEDLLAEALADSDRKIGVVRHVRYPVEVCDLTVEHFTHEEVLGQPDAAEFG